MTFGPTIGDVHKMQALPQAVIKLGGSVVTDKGSDQLRVHRLLVADLAQQIGAAKLKRLVLVHGAGSYGHRIVQRTGIDRGLVAEDSLLAWAETQRLQYQLVTEIAEILIQQGLPAIPCQASASALLKDGQLQEMDVQVASAILQSGGVPLFYGVPAVDQLRGVAILSGDQIAPYLAHALGIPVVIHGTDVDGVFAGDPKAPGAKPVELIHPSNWPELQKGVGGSSNVDVTGGMRGKIQSLIDWVHKGVQARIINATVAGQMSAALAGKAVGTLVGPEVAGESTDESMGESTGKS